MVNIEFVDAGGQVRKVAAEVGDTVMQTAKANGIPGIDADCGGASACATCAVVVDSQWCDRVGPASEIEAMMLECSTIDGPQARLSCQITLTEQLDGLRVTTPDHQQ